MQNNNMQEERKEKTRVMKKIEMSRFIIST